MEEKAVCYYCATVYPADQAKCPLCGSTKRSEDFVIPIRRERITEAERKQRQKGGKYAAQKTPTPKPPKKKAQTNINRKPFLVGALIFLLLAVLVLFGITFVALWMKSPLQKIMMYTALFAVGEGLLWLADAAEIAHYANNSIVFFSVGRYVSQMLCIYALLSAMAEIIRGKSKVIAQIAAYTNGVLSVGYLILNLFGCVTFCEFEQIWYGIEAVLLMVGFGCCLWEFIGTQKGLWDLVRNCIQSVDHCV